MKKSSDKKEFRIYGRNKEKTWKIIWATQGKNKDIQYSAHITKGFMYTSVHQTGEIHNTIRFFGNQPKYENISQKNWTLDNFKYFSILNEGGMTKESLKSVPMTKQKANNKDIVYIDLEDYDRELNYWFFLVEKKLINLMIPQMETQFPNVKFFSPQLFEPTLLIAIFDPSKVNFGKRLILKAKENSTQIVLRPEFKIQFPINESSNENEKLKQTD